MSNESTGELRKSLIHGYAVSSEIKECFQEEGFVALRLVQDTSSVKYCETILVYPGDLLPRQFDTVIPLFMTRCYGDLIVVESDFSQAQNLFKE